VPLNSLNGFVKIDTLNNFSIKINRGRFNSVHIEFSFVCSYSYFEVTLSSIFLQDDLNQWEKSYMLTATPAAVHCNCDIPGLTHNIKVYGIVQFPWGQCEQFEIPVKENPHKKVQ
jgi:hypothetical protein